MLPKKYKKPALILGGLVLLVLILVLSVRLYFTSELITAMITPPLEHYLHRNVTLAEASVGFRGFCVKGLEIRKKGADAPLLKGEKLELRWKFKELFKGRIVIHTLAFTRPEITLVRQKDGSLNIADLLPEMAKAEKTAPAMRQHNREPAGVPLFITLLAMQDGQLNLVDLSQQPQATLRVGSIRSRFTDFSTTAPVPFEIEGQVQGADERSLIIKGTYDLAKDSLKGKMNLQGIDLTILSPFIAGNPRDLIQQGTLTMEAAVAVEDFDHFLTQGSLALSGLKIKKDENLTKTLQIEAGFQLDAVRSQQTLDIGNLDLELNGQKAKIQGVLTQWQQRPHFDFTLNSPQIKLDELLALFSGTPSPSEEPKADPGQPAARDKHLAENVVPEPGSESTTPAVPSEPTKKSEGTPEKPDLKTESTPGTDQRKDVVVEPVASSPAAEANLPPTVGQLGPKPISLDAQGEIHLDWFLYNKLVVSNVDCKLILQNGKLRVEPLSASLYGGALGGSVKSDVESPGPPFQSVIYTENILLDEIIAAFWPQTKGSWSGNVNMISRAKGSGTNLPAVQSRTILNINEAEFSGHPLFVKFAQLFQAEDLQHLRFSQVTARVLTSKGIATLKRFHLVGPIVQAEGTGTASLVDKTLDVHLSLQIRAQYVGKIPPLRDIATKIADKHGFVQLPLTVTGTIDEPVYGLDQRWLAKMAKKEGKKLLKKPEKKQPAEQTAEPPLNQKKQKQLKQGLEELVK
ncbi:MAG: AsmA family protein [Deltaproteobacteria bacterium]|nr:AsmA family protein [Deltaproteobacteria bacterium]